MNADLTCPQCGFADLVQSVPAASAAGTVTSYSDGTVTGVGFAAGNIVPVSGFASYATTHRSALARSLAWAPTLPTAGKLAVGASVLALPGLMVLVVAIAALVKEPPDASGIYWIAAIVGYFVLPALFCLPSVWMMVVAIKRYRRSAKVERGRDRALTAWRYGVYCHRCGSAFWPFSPFPEIPTRVAMPPHHFRWLVWHAGGYARL